MELKAKCRMNVKRNTRMMNSRPELCKCNLASDKVKEEGDNNVIVPILACQLETPIKAVQSTLKKLEKGDSNVKSNGVDKERNNGSIITISIPRTSSKGFMEKKFPSKLKDLLSSGILEGLLVKYVRSIKVKSIGLLGVVSALEFCVIVKFVRRLRDLRLHKLVFEKDGLPDGTTILSNLFQKSKCIKFNENDKAAKQVEDIDPSSEINQRCIRIVKEFELGGCGLCRDQDFSTSFGPRTVIICDQCGKEYHIGCLKDHNMQNIEELPEGDWFCCSDCEHIKTTLVNLVASGEENLPIPLLSLIKKKYNDKGLEFELGIDIKWRLLNWKVGKSEETRQLLSKVVAIFHERFSPIVHTTTGTDYIPTMLFGRNIQGEDFGGMYCMLLTVNEVVVSAGVFRVFGTELAELPLVATVTDFQEQGYFQSLFSCIEGLLGSLKVKRFVLPSAAEAESIWTDQQLLEILSHDDLSRDFLIAEANSSTLKQILL
ncbi:hypothetical protein ACSQ67_022710 [Phaseolus vulgaris]